jgi:hypothetical protein
LLEISQRDFEQIQRELSSQDLRRQGKYTLIVGHYGSSTAAWQKSIFSVVTQRSLWLQTSHAVVIASLIGWVHHTNGWFDVHSFGGNAVSPLAIADIMNPKYEYKFVRFGEGWLSAKRTADLEYQEKIRQNAQDGWRLVQVFAPGMGAYGAAKYYELILEREIPQ